MVYLIIGHEDSGKSKYAEDMAIKMADGYQKIYVATMIPFGQEGQERIKKHQKMREGKGFYTIEKEKNLEEICEMVREYPNATVLLECLTNLVGNELYNGQYNPDQNDETTVNREDGNIVNRVCDEIKALTANCRNLIIVTNQYQTEEDFSEETIRFCRLLSKTNDALSLIADELHTVNNGIWSVYEKS